MTELRWSEKTPGGYRHVIVPQRCLCCKSYLWADGTRRQYCDKTCRRKSETYRRQLRRVLEKISINLE